MPFEFEKYPKLKEYIQEYASFGKFSNWTGFTTALNEALSAKPESFTRTEVEEILAKFGQHYFENGHYIVTPETAKEWLSTNYPKKEGEGMKWIKGTERLPKAYDEVFIKIEGTRSIGKWHGHHEMFMNESGDLFPEDQVEWLDEQSPSPVEGLVAALEWYADAGNYCYQNRDGIIQLATAWQMGNIGDENITKKAKIALKQYKP